jgi:bilirubin oxidase
LERVDVLMVFSDFPEPTGPFMFHCLLLDDEDKGMMGQYVIIENEDTYLPAITQ